MSDAIKKWLTDEGELDESVPLDEVGQAVQELLNSLYDANSLDAVRDKILALHQRLYPGKWTTTPPDESAEQESDDIPLPKPGAALDWMLFELDCNRHNPEIVEQQANDARRMLRDIAALYDLPM